ncbi:MAG TPA: signal peptide peptidase SppA, partial [Deltaproteobacteria bacterium]|nr:signal peptide peptidase SppA [Deltaproteobacteria bacterium]
MRDVSISLATLVLVLLVCLPGCAYISMDLGRLVEMQPFEERVIREGTLDKVLVLEVQGIITTTAYRDGLMPRQGTVERMDSILDLAAKDGRIKGVILKIDSPGGSITASHLLLKQVEAFKTEHKIPVVACITGQGTSGAYMAA